MLKDSDPLRDFEPPDRVDVSKLTHPNIPEFAAFVKGILTEFPFSNQESKQKLLDVTTETLFTDRLNDEENFHTMIQATLRGKIVGFLVGKAVDFEGLPDYQNVAYMTWAGVEKNVRGQDILGKMLSKAEQACSDSGITTVICFIKDENASSIRAVGKSGYREDSLIPSSSRGNSGGKFYSKKLG